MTETERIFLLILIINTVVAIVYFLYNQWYHRKEERHVVAYLMRTIVMLLCPVVGPAFFLAGHMIYSLVFREDVDLEDVIFSKDRVRTFLRANTEQEGNVVPIEEAMAVSDRESLRTLVMNVVRGNVQHSLASLALALNSEDTETSHYAATVLRDVLNDFRQKAQELYLAMNEGGKEGPEYACALIEYMNAVLVQEVFHDMEQMTYVMMMEEACDYLYERDYRQLKAVYIEWLCSLLLRIGEYERLRRWCFRNRDLYPDELSSYTCYLKLYFTIGDKRGFFDTLNRLKQSDVIIDKETLELIRTFG